METLTTEEGERAIQKEGEVVEGMILRMLLKGMGSLLYLSKHVYIYTHIYMCG